jgi:hypothetical protein
MRHSPNDLNELVQAMNSEELRACHGQLKHYQSKYAPALTALLHALREGASAKQQQHAIAKQGHASKLNYLRRILAEQVDLALMVHYRHLTGAMRLQAMHQKVEILLGKRLMRQANNTVNEMLALARTLHNLDAERTTLQLQLTIIMSHGRAYITQHLPVWQRRMEEITHQMHMEDELRVVAKQLFALRREKGTDLTEEDKTWITRLMRHPLLVAPPDTLDVHGRRQYHIAHILYYKLLKQMELALEHHMRLRELWDANPALKHDRPDHYRLMLDNMFDIYFSSKRYAEAASVHEAMRETLLWSQEHNVAYAIKLCINGMLLHLNFAHRQGMLLELEQTEALIREHGMRMEVSSLKALCYNASVCCFLLQQDRAALRWLVILLNRQGEGMRKDLDIQAANLQLMLWYDQSHTEIITDRLEQTDGTDANALSLLLRNSLAKGMANGKIRAGHLFWQQFEHELALLLSGPVPIGFEEMDTWVQAHLHQVPRWQVFMQRSVAGKAA